jgi:uncharacterized protein (DUF3820 family)
MDDMTMPFGEHNGEDIREIYSDYLEWLLGENWFALKFDALRQRIEEEMETRTRSYAHFYRGERRRG